MAIGILDFLKSEFNDEIIGQIGKFIGEDSAKTGSALSSIFPAVLGALARKGSTSQGASEILNLIDKGGFGEGTFKGLSSAFSGGDTAKTLMNAGSNLLGNLFGNNVGNLTDWVGRKSGVAKSGISSLLSLAIPFVLGALGKEVKTSNLNASGLMGLLAGQAGLLKREASPELMQLAGLQDAEPVKKGGSFWKWLIPLLILLAILYLAFKNCGRSPEAVLEDAATEVGQAFNALGEFLTVRLPNGIDLNVPELGVENKLVAFIEDPTKVADEETWFTFDRLEFETGSDVLKPSSMEQLENIAEILKAFPQVTLKIGGYTDNTGDYDANMQLSQRRAENTMMGLVGLGIDPSRLEAEGYGENYPVASNDTEEGRQRNRRIDLRVMGK